MLLCLLLVPVAAGLLAFLPPITPLRRPLLVLAAMVHAGLVAASWVHPATPAWRGLLALDPLGHLFLSVTSALFLSVAWYVVGYLGRERRDERKDFEEGFLFTNAPEASFVGCLLFFLAAMTLVSVSQHFGMTWVGIEATTLASAPLIYFHRHHRSLEAVWKYLMICSVGIGLALLGNFFLAIAAIRPDGEASPLLLPGLLVAARALDPRWLRLAFILLLVGYGTKMGLAPLHTWLPDAHSEAPSAVSALLSGALLNCAFLGILRGVQVCSAAGLGDYAGSLLTVFGVLSMLTAAIFLTAQADYKRMLAYSSVEHMGVLALGVGIGGGAGLGAMLHLVGHSLAKTMLFLVAGNILHAYRTKSADEVRGVLHRLPVSGALWVAGLFAITGTPPFALFLSEFLIVRAAFDHGRVLLAILFLVLLGWIFAAMARIMLGMAQGMRPADGSGTATRSEPLLAVVPPAILALAVLALGLFLPGPLRAALDQAAAALGRP
jgi:hydrogenase-4 component F